MLQHIYWIDSVVKSPRSSWVKSGGLNSYIHDFVPGFLRHYAKVNYLLPDPIERVALAPKEKLISFVREALSIVWER